MQIFNSGFFWFVEGILSCVVVLGIRAWSLDRSIPLHFSAYRPAWKLQAPATPVATLARAAEIAAAKLDFVYIGNARMPGAADTRCPGCNGTVVSREGYRTEITLTADGDCPDCGRHIMDGIS